MKRVKKNPNNKALFIVLILFLFAALVDYVIIERKVELQRIVLGDQINTSNPNITPFYETIPSTTTSNNVYSNQPNIYTLTQGAGSQTQDNRVAVNNTLEAPLENQNANPPAADVIPANNPAQNAPAQPIPAGNDLLTAICKVFPFLLICQPQQPVQPAQPIQLPLPQPLPKPQVIVPVLPVVPAQINPPQNPCNIIKKYCSGDILEWDYYRLDNNQPPAEVLCQTPRAIGNCNADRSGKRTCGIVTINGNSSPRCVDR